MQLVVHHTAPDFQGSGFKQTTITVAAEVPDGQPAYGHVPMPLSLDSILQISDTTALSVNVYMTRSHRILLLYCCGAQLC